MERRDVLQRHEDVAVQLDVRDVLDVAVRGEHAFLVLAPEEGLAVTDRCFHAEIVRSGALNTATGQVTTAASVALTGATEASNGREKRKNAVQEKGACVSAAVRGGKAKYGASGSPASARPVSGAAQTSSQPRPSVVAAANFFFTDTHYCAESGAWARRSARTARRARCKRDARAAAADT
mgnify:CR=1 FL=1